MKVIFKIFDAKFIKFILVGILNTAVSMAIMFLLYNLAHFGYWGSSAISFFIASIISFILNKNFTFSSDESTLKSALKFAVTIGICYLLAYSISKPIVIWALSKFNLKVSLIEQISMLVGMVIFTLLNYFSQRFFVFSRKEKKI